MKKNKVKKYIRIAGFIFVGILILASILFMFVLDTNFDADDRKNWLIGFG